MSRDILDAFERRHGKRQFEEGDFPKLTADEKRMLLNALTEKIVELQKKIEPLQRSNFTGKPTAEFASLTLSQMMLMWTHDQIKYGKM